MKEHGDSTELDDHTTVDSDGLISSYWYYTIANWNKQNHYWVVTHSDFSGHTFLPRITKKDGIVYIYTKILADSGTASKFMVDIEVVNAKNKISLKFPGAKVYPVDMKWQDVIEDEDGVLSFDQNMAKKLFSVSNTDKTKYVIAHKTTIKQK